MKSYIELEWFDCETGEMVSSEKLNISIDEAKDLFFVEKDEPFAGQPVQACQREGLKNIVKHEIDLNKYDYFAIEVDEANESE